MGQQALQIGDAAHRGDTEAVVNSAAQVAGILMMPGGDHERMQREGLGFEKSGKSLSPLKFEFKGWKPTLGRNTEWGMPYKFAVPDFRAMGKELFTTNMIAGSVSKMFDVGKAGSQHGFKNGVLRELGYNPYMRGRQVTIGGKTFELPFSRSYATEAMGKAAQHMSLYDAAEAKALSDASVNVDKMSPKELKALADRFDALARPSRINVVKAEENLAAATDLARKVAGAKPQAEFGANPIEGFAAAGRGEGGRRLRAAAPGDPGPQRGEGLRRRAALPRDGRGGEGPARRGRREAGPRVPARDAGEAEGSRLRQARAGRESATAPT